MGLVVVTHVVLAADAAYIEYAACSITQISRHGRQADGIVLLTPPEVPDEPVERLQAHAVRRRVDLEVVRLGEVSALTQARAIAERDHVSTFTYSKLFMADALPEHDEVLYLDVDTLVREDIGQLLDWQLSHPIAAVHELGDNGRALFGTTRVSYFNAGVLRMSLERLRERELSRRALAVLAERPRLPFQDQDVLNLLFRDDHDTLPLAFNVFDTVAAEALPSWKLLRDPAIVHFVGPLKPWHRASRSRFAREWRHVQARSAGLGANDVQAFVNEQEIDTRDRLSMTITRARHSPVGRRVRAALPLDVKHAVNMGLLKALPPRSRLGHGMRTGLWTEQPTPPASPRAGDVRQQTGRGRLVLVLSLPRSGTTALNSLIRGGAPGTHVEGELFYGLLHEPTVHRLAPRYPWIGDRASAFGRTGVDDPSAANWKRYRALMNEHAVDVATSLIDGRHEPTVIKLFSHHLDPQVLDDLVAATGPEIVVLRRPLLFSYLSHLKAARAGSWTRSDNTDEAIRLDESATARYVADADAWIATVRDLCARHNRLPLWLTYSGLLEGGEEIPGLAALLDEAGASTTKDPRQWRAHTLVQDRRTDLSLLENLQEYSQLPHSLQRDLLRLPGEAAIVEDHPDRA